MSVIGIENTATLMKRVAVIPIEGVLKKPVGGQVNEDGLYLFRAISEWYRVILITNETNQRWVREWLDKEGVFRYDDILYGNMCINTMESYWTNMIRILRTRGYNISLCVVNSPSDALDVVNSSVPVLMYSQPSYGLPEWLPGSRRGAEEWDSLVDKIETERSARINDRRMDELIQ